MEEHIYESPRDPSPGEENAYDSLTRNTCIEVINNNDTYLEPINPIPGQDVEIINNRDSYLEPINQVQLQDIEVINNRDSYPEPIYQVPEQDKEKKNQSGQKISKRNRIYIVLSVISAVSLTSLIVVVIVYVNRTTFTPVSGHKFTEKLNRPVDCKDAYSKGKRSNGVYTIYPKGDRTGYQVYCDMTTDGGGWTVFQRRFNGLVDFYRTWGEYMNGFGDVNGEYWLGNEKIYELTSQGSQTLRIDLMDQDGIRKYAVYEGFHISDNSTGYTLIIGKYSGTAGDSLTTHNGKTFETKDQQRSRKCATRFTGAWWYNTCHDANLNGLYNNTEFGKGMNWYHWHGHEYSMKATEMKIRRM